MTQPVPDARERMIYVLLRETIHESRPSEPGAQFMYFNRSFWTTKNLINTNVFCTNA